MASPTIATSGERYFETLLAKISNPEEAMATDVPSSAIHGDDDDEEADEPPGWESGRRSWTNVARSRLLASERAEGRLERAKEQYVDDLSSDDSENEDLNRTGRVPLHWYEGYEHIGYDISGQKVRAAEGLGDSLDAALRVSDNGGWVVYDKLNGREVVLSAREMETVRRIAAGAYGSEATEAYPDYVDWVSSQIEAMPLTGGQYEPKRRFVPSKWEAMKVARIAQGLKRGTILPAAELEARRRKARDPEAAMAAFAETLWTDDDVQGAPLIQRAPKLQLPGHEASYRAPEEYEGAARHGTLRQLGAYGNAVNERFERCLDLYLCPRGVKRRLNIDPESLVPKLPSPNDLKPFPNAAARTFVADAPVVSVSVSPDGQFIATLDDNGTVKVWEVLTARCLRNYQGGGDQGSPSAVAWNPVADHHIIAAAVGGFLRLILSEYTARGEARLITDALLSPSTEATKKTENLARWEETGIHTAHQIRTVSWHAKGDYVATVSPSAPPSLQVVVHRLSKRQSQAPFKSRLKGPAVQACSFHPNKPFLFVATKTQVKVYHLVQQRLVKTLVSTCKWISALTVHSTGDHCVVGSCDRRINWFDLDLSDKPYKTLKYHDRALRAVDFHPTLPLLASCADDAQLFVLHAQVYADLTRNPLIVPLTKFNTQDSIDLCFHPKLPWLFATTGSQVVLYHNLG